MTVRCEKCRGIIGLESAFAARFNKQGKHLLHEVVKSTTLKDGEIAMHLNGDRGCGKPVAGYKRKIVEAVGISMEIDTSFLDFI